MSPTTSVEIDGLPVTVSFTRRADPEHAREMTAWVRAGLSLAEEFPGFLGGGWVRPRGGADEWHMLCRFADQQSMAAWDSSPERQWWLRSAHGLAEITRTERRTGIEGWFDAPVTTEITAPAPRPAPPRWKQAVTIWLVFFPLNLLAAVTLGALVADLQRAPVAALAPSPPRRHLDAAARKAELIAAVIPSLGPRLEALLDALAADLPASVALVPAHGDFHVDQLLIGADRIAVIDFDQMCVAAPALDIATYAADVVRGRESDLDAVGEVLEPLLDGYGRRPEALEWHLSAAILGRAAHPFHRQVPQWRERVEAMVTAAEAARA